jgi:PAS domain S-box-containing protein
VAGFKLMGQSRERQPAGVADRGALVSAAAAESIVGAAILALATEALGFTVGAPWVGLIAAPVLAYLAYNRFHARRSEIDRNHATQAQLSLYRVGETLGRAEREEDLVRHALEAIARGTGIPHWAIFLHRDERGELELAATLGLPEGADAELKPDTVGPEASSPASRASWSGETQVEGDPASIPEWSFPARTEGLGVGPVVVSIPIAEHGDKPGVLQCFLPAGTAVGSERGTLLRWIAAQVSSGLKRLRMEQRDQLLASFMMSTGEILLGVDLGGEITHANTAAERALGATPGALIGSRLDQITALETAAPGGDTLFDLARSSGEYSGVIWFLRGDGSRFPSEVRVSPATNRAGALSALVLVGRDITERREQDLEQKRRAEELAQVNEALHRANRSLEEAKQLQNDYLANVSHELRTPMNAVIGFATLLETNAQNSAEEGQDFARSIREAAQHLLSMINDLLDLAKVEAGRFELSLVPGDLRPSIQSAAAAVGPIAAKKGLNLNVDLPVDALVVALDPARMKQVMLNLLGNAVKFTDKGTVEVRAWRDLATDEARVLIADSGIGIAPERQARLFTKYGQAGSSYSRRHTGTGLGLAITQVLVKNMGGTIEVESEGLNRGTRVSLAFPAPIASHSERD